MSKSGTILYVDDDKDDREVFDEVLKHVAPSLVCMLAKDAEHAFSLIREARQLPLCIYADMNMPKQSGLEFLKTLKNDRNFSHIPVFIISTSSLPKYEAEAISLGAAGYLVKPNSYSGFTKLLKLCFAAHI